MTNLSQAAKAVLDAYQSASIEDGATAAAVIRAVAGQFNYEIHGEGWYELVVDVKDLYALADELEGIKYGTYRCEIPTNNNE
jgi:hypothetical protein